MTEDIAKRVKELEESYKALGDKIAKLKEKHKRFPQVGEKYWYYDHLFKVYSIKASENSLRRAFKTAEEAQQAAEIEKAKIELKYIIQELNDGWVPDFKISGTKYYVRKNRSECINKVDSTVRLKSLPSWMYLKSSELAERLIKDHPELLEIVLSE